MRTLYLRRDYAKDLLTTMHCHSSRAFTVLPITASFQRALQMFNITLKGSQLAFDIIDVDIVSLL